MFFKKKIKAEKLALPILSKEVYERCEDENDRLPYSETIYSYDNPLSMQTMALSFLESGKDLKNIKKVAFLYIDEEFLDWASKVNASVNMYSIGQYSAYILSQPDADNIVERLWKKNIKESFILNFLFFNLKNKQDSHATKFKIKRLNTDSFIDSFKEKVGDCWVSPILFSQDDVVNYAKRLKDVGEASLKNEKIRLGILEQETCTINSNVALLPFINKIEIPSCTIDLEQFKKSPNLRDADSGIDEDLSLIKTTVFPDTLLNAIATSGEMNDVIISPIANYSMPEFILDNMRIEVD